MVSAIPENLIKYSATCTGAAQEVQNWVRSVLTPALLAYQNTGHPCVELDAEVATAISRAYYTDRDVHQVALAFQHSQHAHLGPGGLVTTADSAVNSAYAALLQVNQQKMRQGAALAARLMALQDMGDRHHPDAARPLVDELKQHQNDPYFCAGFFNALTGQPQLTTVLALGGIPALVSAYRSGAVSKRTTAMVAARMMIPAGVGGPDGPTSPFYKMSSAQKGQLLDAFAADPSASYQLAKALTPAEVREMFYGDRQFAPKVMKVLLVAMSGEHAPQSARDLMHKVSIGLFGDGAPKLTNSEWKPVIGPVRAFYMLGMTNSVSAPTDFSHQGLENWETVTGAQQGQDLALFLHAVNSADPDHALLKSMLQGGYVNVGFEIAFGVLQPESVAAKWAVSASLGALQSLYSSKEPGMGLLDRWLPAGEAPDAHRLNQQLAAGGLLQTLDLLGSGGHVYDNAGHQVHFTGDRAHDSRALTAMLKEPDRYTVGTGKDGKRVTVDELSRFYGDSEKDESSRGLNQNYEPPPYQ